MNKVAIVFLSVFCVGMLQAQSFTVDTVHSSVGFKIKHMMISNVQNDHSGCQH